MLVLASKNLELEIGFTESACTDTFTRFQPNFADTNVVRIASPPRG